MTEIVSVPAVGVIAKSELGQTIISKANLIRKPAIFISSIASDNSNPPGVTTIKS